MDESVDNPDAPAASPLPPCSAAREDVRARKSAKDNKSAIALLDTA